MIDVSDILFSFWNKIREQPYSIKKKNTSSKMFIKEPIHANSLVILQIIYGTAKFIVSNSRMLHKTIEAFINKISE
jgi:hypothetical protein